ncbi:MAG: ATP-binding protein, partial [Anaerolineae bacterium]
MRPFHTIAVPHDDILQGRLTLDVFAADLWEVHRNRGPEEYRDADLFFRKTYLTQGLRNLLAVVEGRLGGRGGDPVIQMQTPFGGGKTHALIALYHRAREWGVRTAVLVGTPLPPRETLWGLLAEQLTGSRAGFADPVAPGRDALQGLLRAHQPVLVLMDEVLEYITKAAGVTVGDSTLAAQTLAFLQELTEAVATLDRAALVVTLPSSTLEHYDPATAERAIRLFEQLKKISGRVEKILTPVQDEEVGEVIRRRLFASVDEAAAAQAVHGFLEQAEQEALLPRGEESAAYRARFRRTYPFLPEVVDVLYHRWGSFPSFQRTRGVLHLLALVVHALRTSPRPIITLADFPLDEAEIRRELLNHIGNEYDSVLAADITGPQAGARRADLELGRSYQGLNLGLRVATTLFMYSFVGGGGEGGATAQEVKRHNLLPGVPASVVAEVLGKLSDRLLFYLHESGGRYAFSTTANLNRALVVRMENVGPEDIRRAEREALSRRLSGRALKTYLWPDDPAGIPDDPSPKLLILPEADRARMERFLNEKGQTPRVHRNTLFFLAPSRAERGPFEDRLRRWLALSSLLEDRTLSLTAEQRRELEGRKAQVDQELQEQVGNLYRLLYLPYRDGPMELDMGIPTYGGPPYLEERVYERLRAEGRIVEKLAPLVVRERYLADRDFVETRLLAESGPRTPGEMLVSGPEVW